MTTLVVPKDLVAKLDYRFDWRPKTNGVDLDQADWLGEGEIITGYDLVPSGDLTVASSNLTDNDSAVVYWLNPSEARGTHTVSCTIETNQNRVDRRTMVIDLGVR